MMKKLIIVLPLTVLLFSCKQAKEKLIQKKWQAILLESPQMDAVLKENEQFIDTLGTHTDDATNIVIYGTTNVDSLRESLRAQFNDYKAMQAHSIKNTWFHFRKDGMVTMNFSGQPDSTLWYFDDEGVLILDEMKLKGTGNRLKMNVKSLTDDTMKLAFNEDNISSTVTFIPVNE